MKKILFFLVLFISCFLIPSFVLAQELERPIQPDYAKARILQVNTYCLDEQVDPRFKQISQDITLRILSGDYRNKVVSLKHMASGMIGNDMILKPGDKVLVFVDKEPTEAESPTGEPLFYIADYVRNTHVLWLVFFYCLLLIVVGGLKGFKSFISLLITIALLFFVLFPLVLSGFNPLLASILIVGLVSFIVFWIIGGMTIKGLSAAIGTFVGVAIAGIIALIVGKMIHLTGTSSEEARMLLYSTEMNLDFQGLLFGSILIGALGAIMDVGMSIASAIDEIKKHNAAAEFSSLFEAGMNVGKDVMGTMSNTLILAYTGSALPLLLLFIANHVPISKIINMELISAEIVRALAGSTGLVLCIPITALVAAIMHSRVKKKP